MYVQNKTCSKHTLRICTHTTHRLPLILLLSTVVDGGNYGETEWWCRCSGYDVAKGGFNVGNCMRFYSFMQQHSIHNTFNIIIVFNCTYRLQLWDGIKWWLFVLRYDTGRKWDVLLYALVLFCGIHALLVMIISWWWWTCDRLKVRMCIPFTLSKYPPTKASLHPHHLLYLIYVCVTFVY